MGVAHFALLRPGKLHGNFHVTFHDRPVSVTQTKIDTVAMDTSNIEANFYKSVLFGRQGMISIKTKQRETT